MNKNYEKGRRLEYQVVNEAKKIKKQAARTAGSHSPYDVVIPFQYPPPGEEEQVLKAFEPSILKILRQIDEVYYDDEWLCYRGPTKVLKIDVRVCALVQCKSFQKRSRGNPKKHKI